MITLTINNSYSLISNLTRDQHKSLRNILSYNIDSSTSYFSNNKFHTKRYLIDNKGHFPTGLLPLVKTYIKQTNLKANIIDLRKIPTKSAKFNMSLKHTPYTAQKEALKRALAHHHGVLSLPTGTGKSLIIALIIGHLNVKSLIVVPNLEIKKQLQADFIEIFGSLKNITIENIDSSELKKDIKYDLLIIDEAHRAAAKTYQILNKNNWNDIYYRFFLTATPFRTNEEENILFQAITGQVIFKLTYQQAVSLKYIVPVEAYYIELEKTSNDYYSWAEVYSSLITNNMSRNQIIADLLLNLQAQNISTLCLIKEVKHGESIQELTNIPFSNGKDETTRQFITQFNKKQISCLIGTEGLLSEGVDTKPCEYVIIAALGKAKSAFMQKIGRAIRTFPGKESAKVILFKDKSHKYTIKHFNEQCKILKEEYGIIPEKIEF